MGFRVFYLLFIMATAQSATSNESCRDLLQGYLTGRLSSAAGRNQIEALRREFKKNDDDLKKTIGELKEQFKSDLQTDSRNRSVVYTRWGKKTCPSDAEQVLSGYVGGSHYTYKGAAVEPLCLPRDPEWRAYKDGHDGMTHIWGAEYENSHLFSSSRSLANQDVPCAVCLVRNRSVVKMFPARKTCYNGWKLEYHGYLMAGHYSHEAGTQFTCVDHHPDSIHGGQADANGKLFYFVEVICGSLRCPPYVDGRELVCAVCSKE